MLTWKQKTRIVELWNETKSPVTVRRRFIREVGLTSREKLSAPSNKTIYGIELLSISTSLVQSILSEKESLAMREQSEHASTHAPTVEDVTLNMLITTLLPKIVFSIIFFSFFSFPFAFNNFNYLQLINKLDQLTSY